MATQQTMIAVSEEFMAYVKEICAKFSGPSKTKDVMHLNQKEACDCIMDFVQSCRFVMEDETSEQGETIQVECDYLEGYAQAIIAARMDKVTTRQSAAEKQLQGMSERVRKLLVAQGLEGEELEQALQAVCG